MSYVNKMNLCLQGEMQQNSWACSAHGRALKNAQMCSCNTTQFKHWASNLAALTESFRFIFAQYLNVQHVARPQHCG